MSYLYLALSLPPIAYFACFVANIIIEDLKLIRESKERMQRFETRMEKYWEKQ